MDKSSLKLRIKDILAEKGMTGVELANKLGKKKSYIYSIMAGGAATSLNSLMLLAEALDVPFYDLFERPVEHSGRAVEELKRMVITELSFPSDASPRHLGALLDALKASIDESRWTQFVTNNIAPKITEQLFTQTRSHMSPQTASDIKTAMAH